MTPDRRFQLIENLRYAQKRLPDLAKEIGNAPVFDVTIPHCQFAAMFGGGIRLNLRDHPQVIAAVRAEIEAQSAEVENALRELDAETKGAAS